ncbi:ankyrin repeats (3 copies) domain-containing protein [Trichoderma breve]|uniref:Ankyrin repeats (3 copies) domain-containing protein n=1 Tax=Trichoderma breve TaxID=2034170 RepID=A0A9W9E6J9_9HYPO|nr:ankyrin repeats (3 copies) domain-containing protein [Trichoderma breve]KAJ4856536.1 ankyrin repeats (3 copies) domain-containing protein [Trichoderma breve]
MGTEVKSRKRDFLKPRNWFGRPRSSSRASSGRRISTSARASTSSHSDASLELSRDPLLSHTSERSSRQRLSAPLVESQLAKFHLTPPLRTTKSQPPPSTKVSDLWARAFTEANDETQKWIKKHGLDSPTGLAQGQIKEVIKLIESNKLSEQNDQPWKIEIGNQKIIVREYIADAVAFITMVGDAAITFAPPQASAPWAVAKAVLKIPVKQIEQKAALLGTIQWFARIVRRGQIYEAIYLYNAAATDEKNKQNLYDALLDVYKTALELLASSETLFDSRIARQALKAVLRPEGATGKVKDLSRKEQQLSLEVQACEASQSAVSSKQANDSLKELKKQLDHISSPLPRIDKGVVKLLAKVEKEELEKLMEFISKEKFGKSHAEVVERRIEETGNWLLANEHFRAWQDVPSSSAVLCLKGTVGTGKTFLTSKAIDYVKQTLNASQHDEGFAYFYCNRGTSMQDPMVVLRSFVRHLVHKCEIAKREGRDLGYKDCKDFIMESLNLYSKTTIILDALDESDITTHNLCTILIQMMEESRRPVKIFISTRPDRKYIKAFQDRRIITLDASNQQDDIERFLDEKLYSTESFMERSQEAQDEIKHVFATRSCGMFRWVYLQVRSLENHITDDAVHNWAHKLPRNLTEAYDQLWDNMRGHDDFDVNLAERAIMWVLCSFEPLRSHILLEAIQYAVQGSTVVRKEKQTQQQILSLCQDLLTIDEERGVWMLPHASVAEYFESRGYTNWKCHVFASKVCLGVLENFWPEEIEYETFAEYVGDSWGRHVEEYDQWLETTEGENEATKADPDLTEALERFLGSPGESSANYRQWAEHDEKRSNDFNPNNLSLLAACQYGLWYTLRDWWLNSKMTIEMAFEKNGNEETSLMLAAKSNCLPMVKHLVDLIDVMDQYAAENCVVALNCALAEEHFDIMKFFIMEAKVDVNLPSRSKDGITAAQVATDFSPATLQWMLDQGLVDVQRENDAGYMHGNILITAVYRQKVESVQILLKAGANANAVVHKGENGSPLIIAVDNADPAIVRLLLEHGADPNLPRTGNYGSALEASMTPRGNERVNQKERDEIQRMLLDAGADPTAVSDRGFYKSALAAAAFWGEKEIVTAMIDRVGAERAIQVLRQSTYPNIQRYFKDDEDVQRWKDTITYLGQVGVNKETLRAIGLREDIELESTGLSSPGKYLLDYPKLSNS